MSKGGRASNEHRQISKDAKFKVNNHKSEISNPKLLWLVRHGESTANVVRQKAESEKLAAIEFPEREPDVPLSKFGRSQSFALGNWFAKQTETPTVIYSSPYLRTIETTEIIRFAAHLDDIEIRLDERLRERELGIFDRLTKLGAMEKHAEECAKRELLGKFYHRPPGGESWVDVILRLRSFIESDLSKLENERVLIVTHEVVVHCFRYILENLTESEILAIDSARDVAKLRDYFLRIWRRGLSFETRKFFCLRNQTTSIISFKDLRVMSGIFACSEGKPTGISTNGTSVFGRPRISCKNFIGEGVCVSVAKPILCSAASRKPTAMPTDSCE